MTPAFRWAAVRATSMFHNCEGQSHKTVSTDSVLAPVPNKPTVSMDVINSNTQQVSDSARPITQSNGTQYTWCDERVSSRIRHTRLKALHDLYVLVCHPHGPTV